MPINPDEKTFRVPVKLVSAIDGVELPLGLFAMIPEPRLRLLENIAIEARNLLEAHEEAKGKVGVYPRVEGALMRLDSNTKELAEIWEFKSGAAS
jgi:hypothetical protein